MQTLLQVHLLKFVFHSYKYLKNKFWKTRLHPYAGIGQKCPFLYKVAPSNAAN